MIVCWQTDCALMNLPAQQQLHPRAPHPGLADERAVGAAHVAHVDVPAAAFDLGVLAADVGEDFGLVRV